LLTLFWFSIFFWRCIPYAYPCGLFSCLCPDDAFQENAYTMDLFQQHMLFLIEGILKKRKEKRQGRQSLKGQNETIKGVAPDE